MSILAKEFKGSVQTATWNPSGPVLPSTASTELQRTARLLSLFLPEGYPESVPADYLPYQFWDSIQALCSYVRGILTSEAILSGAGYNESRPRKAYSMVFQFFLRDFSGMLGGVLFATLQGSGLDNHAKQWRLFADCLNNVGMALELASPLYPPMFLVLACLGSIARSITGVAGGATRAALTQHFSQGRSNAADISAKEGSQETATTLVGMLVGMLITHVCTGLPVLSWAVFLVLTCLHIFANVKAMRALQVKSINTARLEVLLSHVLNRQTDVGHDLRVLTPGEVAGLGTSPCAAFEKTGFLSVGKEADSCHSGSAASHFGGRDCAASNRFGEHIFACKLHC
eukprot:jgi/Botrbrau1/11804/Bobra.0224s0010.2